MLRLFFRNSSRKYVWGSPFQRVWYEPFHIYFFPGSRFLSLDPWNLDMYVTGRDRYRYQRFRNTNDAHESFSIGLTHWPRLHAAVNKRRFACRFNCNNSCCRMERNAARVISFAPNAQNCFCLLSTNCFLWRSVQVKICISILLQRYQALVSPSSKVNSVFFLHFFHLFIVIPAFVPSSSVSLESRGLSCVLVLTVFSASAIMDPLL